MFKGSFLSWHIKVVVMKLLDYKTRTGMVLAGLYLLPIIWIFISGRVIYPLLILTVPCSVVLVLIFNSFGIFMVDHADSFGIFTSRGIDDYIVLICGLIGGAINTLALYFFGYLLTRMFVSLKKAVWDK